MDKKPFHLSNRAFWLLALAIWGAAEFFGWQLRYVFAPFRLLSVWVHEMGHGVGAMMTDGHFKHLVLNSDMSGGHAVTSSRTVLSRVVSIATGLLGPSIAGFAVIVSTRRFKSERIMLLILFGALIITSALFSGDMFTRIVTFSLALPFGALAFWGPEIVRSVFIQTVGILFCLNAITGIHYFFMDSAKMQQPGMLADTDALAQILGGPQLLWGGLLTINALLILYFAARFSIVRSPEKTRPKIKPVN